MNNNGSFTGYFCCFTQILIIGIIIYRVIKNRQLKQEQKSHENLIQRQVKEHEDVIYRLTQKYAKCFKCGSHNTVAVRLEVREYGVEYESYNMSDDDDDDWDTISHFHYNVQYGIKCEDCNKFLLRKELSFDFDHPALFYRTENIGFPIYKIKEDLQMISNGDTEELLRLYRLIENSWGIK